MLIASPRHTRRDLEQWALDEDADAVYCQTAAFARRIAAARAALLTFVATGRCYVGVSWGKDSVVVAHLASQMIKPPPLVWVRVEPVSNPDCVLVRDAFLRAYPGRYSEIVVDCATDGVRLVGTGRLAEGFEIARQRFGQRYVSGVRGDESRDRRMRMARWGESSPNTCAPIGRWTAADVFAYLYVNKLPVHPAYAQTQGGLWRRDRIRVASLGGSRGTGNGRAEWERLYYGAR